MSIKVTVDNLVHRIPGVWHVESVFSIQWIRRKNVEPVIHGGSRTIEVHDPIKIWNRRRIEFTIPEELKPDQEQKAEVKIEWVKPEWWSLTHLPPPPVQYGLTIKGQAVSLDNVCFKTEWYRLSLREQILFKRFIKQELGIPIPKSLFELYFSKENWTRLKAIMKRAW